MKKFFIVCGVFLSICISFLTAGFIVRDKEYAKFPEGGIYFAAADSYYSYSDKTYHPFVTLTCFEVHKGDAKKLLAYQNMYLTDSQGNEFTVQDASIVYTFTDAYFSRAVVQLVLDLNEFEENQTYLFTKLYLSDGEIKKPCDIGKVRIATFDVGDNAAQIGFSGYTSGATAFSSYVVSVTNNGAANVYFKACMLDVTVAYEIAMYDLNGNTSAFENYCLESGETVYVRVTFQGNTAQTNTPFNYIKPAFRFENEQEEFVLSVPYISDYVGNMDRQEIQAYLKGRAGV